MMCCKKLTEIIKDFLLSQKEILVMSTRVIKKDDHQRQVLEGNVEKDKKSITDLGEASALTDCPPLNSLSMIYPETADNL